RIAVRFEDVGFAAEVADRRRRQLCAAADVGQTIGVGGDGRDVDELAESGFETIAFFVRKRNERLLFKTHGGAFYRQPQRPPTGLAATAPAAKAAAGSTTSSSPASFRIAGRGKQKRRATAGWERGAGWRLSAAAVSSARCR